MALPNPPSTRISAELRPVLRAALQQATGWKDYARTHDIKLASFPREAMLAAANYFGIDVELLASQNAATSDATATHADESDAMTHEHAHKPRPYDAYAVSELSRRFSVAFPYMSPERADKCRDILKTVVDKQDSRATERQFATVDAIVRIAERAKAAGATANTQAFEAAETRRADDAAHTPPTVTRTPKAATGNKLLDAIQELVGDAMDPDTVREMVKAEVASAMAAQPTVRIELTRHGEVTGKAEGHHHPLFPLMCRILSARKSDGFAVNLWIAGPAGAGKSYAAKAFAKAAGLNYFFHGAMDSAFEVLGFKDAGGTYHRTPFRDAFEHGGVVVFEEVDSWGASATLALNSATANGLCAFPDGIVTRHKDCIIIACANTWGGGGSSDYVGRNKLDAAFIDRFSARLAWDYDTALEVALSGNPAWARRVQAARERARSKGLKVIISPRATLDGAAMIAQGLTPDEVASVTYLANLTAEQKKMVEGTF